MWVVTYLRKGEIVSSVECWTYMTDVIKFMNWLEYQEWKLISVDYDERLA